MKLRKVFLTAALALGLAHETPAAPFAPVKDIAAAQTFTAAAQKKHTRKLTPDEIALAKTIFGNALDYNAVTIHSNPIFLMGKKTARTPNNNIYMGNRYCEDYAAPENAALSPLLIHELVHVWEHQNKVLRLLPAEIKAYVGNGLSRERVYQYTADSNKDLLDYNVEQMAEIIEHYFTIKDRNLDYFARIEAASRYNTDGTQKPQELWQSKETLYTAHRIDLKVHEEMLKNFLKDPAYAKNFRKMAEWQQEEWLAKWRKPPGIDSVKN